MHEFFRYTIAWFGVDVKQEVQRGQHLRCQVLRHGGMKQVPVALLATFDVLSFR